jgi:hypothetical protein
LHFLIHHPNSSQLLDLHPALKHCKINKEVIMKMDRQDYFSIQEEKRQERRDHLRFAAGMSDFIGVIVGVVAILILVLLILSLLNWLRRDISTTFSVMNARFL